MIHWHFLLFFYGGKAKNKFCSMTLWFQAPKLFSLPSTIARKQHQVLKSFDTSSLPNVLKGLMETQKQRLAQERGIKVRNMRRPYMSILASTAGMSQLDALSVEKAQEQSAILPTLPIVQTIMLSSTRSNVQAAAGGHIGSQFMALIPQRAVIYLDWSRFGASGWS